jgi:hypothetical protein
MNNKPLDRATVQQAVAAVRRLQQLIDNKSPIISKENANQAAEIRGLQDFLRNLFDHHAGEFLACWFVVRDEYEPLIGMFSMVKLRADSFIAAARQNEIAKQEEHKK